MNFLTQDSEGRLWDGDKRWIGTGTNLVAQEKWGYAIIPDDPQGVVRLADDLARYKLNCVRVRHLDALDVAQGGVWKPDNTKDIGFLNLVDRFFAECAKRDIRVFWSFDETDVILPKLGFPQGYKVLKTPGPARTALIEHYKWFLTHTNVVTGIRYCDDPLHVVFSPFNELRWGDKGKWDTPDPTAEASLYAEIRAAVKAVAPNMIYIPGQSNYCTSALWGNCDGTDLHTGAARAASGRSANPTSTIPAKVQDDFFIRRSTRDNMAGTTYGRAFAQTWGMRFKGKTAGHTEAGVGVSRGHHGSYFPFMAILGALHDTDFWMSYTWRYNKFENPGPGDLCVEGYPGLMLQHELVSKIRAYGGIQPMPISYAPLSSDPTKFPLWENGNTGPNHAYAMRRMVVDKNAVAEPIPANTNTVRVISSPGTEWDFETGNCQVDTPTMAFIGGVIPKMVRVGEMVLETDEEWMGHACWISDDGRPLIEGGPASFYTMKDSLPADFSWIDGVNGEYWSHGTIKNINLQPDLKVSLSRPDRFVEFYPKEAKTQL